jgi:hypothetical protein
MKPGSHARLACKRLLLVKQYTHWCTSPLSSVTRVRVSRARLRRCVRRLIFSSRWMEALQWSLMSSSSSGSPKSFMSFENVPARNGGPVEFERVTWTVALLQSCCVTPTHAS